MAQQACNGYSSLCSKSYNEVSYLTTHNSYAYMSNVGQNQHYDVQTQLNDGIRGLKLSAVKSSNYTGVELCHTACNILDSGTAHDTLSVIASWLKNNPNEVVTIMWNNLGNFSASDLQSEYQQASGIMDYLYVQPNNNYTWPTLSEMISSGKRLVNFMDVNADQTTVPWLHAEYTYIFETPYDNTNVNEFGCTVDRPQDPANPGQMMYVMNNFIYGTLEVGSIQIEIPQPYQANNTNAAAFENHATNCTSVFGRPPNFLEVDFYDWGTTFQVLDKLNNVTYVVKSLNHVSPDAGDSDATSGIDAFGEAAFTTAAALTLVAILVTLMF
ncbi:hypothetical protein NQZ79_g8529 [Umbelopsis isabellina]|nr:hypothetical protein NQZ79_g8529 [Umbelopsis isabellina]